MYSHGIIVYKNTFIKLIVAAGMDQVSLQTRVTDLENQLASRATQYNEQVDEQ